MSKCQYCQNPEMDYFNKENPCECTAEDKLSILLEALGCPNVDEVTKNGRVVEFVGKRLHGHAQIGGMAQAFLSSIDTEWVFTLENSGDPNLDELIHLARAYASSRGPADKIVELIQRGVITENDCKKHMKVYWDKAEVRNIPPEIRPE